MKETNLRLENRRLLQEIVKRNKLIKVLSSKLCNVCRHKGRETMCSRCNRYQFFGLEE